MAKIETCKLYNGKCILTFDPDTHIYSVNGGDPIPGVTTIVGVMDKSGPLMRWAVNIALEHIEEKIKPGKSLDELQLKTLWAEAKRQPYLKRDEAADAGTIIHEWCEAHIKFALGLAKKKPAKPINELIRLGVGAFLKWEKENEVIYHSSERRLYSEKYGYAGTMDFDATVGGKRTLGDFKTGKAIYPSMMAQTAAYQQALEEEMGIKFEQRVIIRLDKATGKFDPTLMGSYRKDLKMFLACLDIHSRLKELKGGEKT